MKATEIEFSAKSRLKRFGIINAIPKASAEEVVPKNDAFVISRTSPIILEAKVMSERTSPDFTKDFFPINQIIEKKKDIFKLKLLKKAVFNHILIFSMLSRQPFI